MPRLRTEDELPKQARRVEHAERMSPMWWTTKAVLIGPVATITKLRTEHIERIPETGPGIVVVNHVSHVDPLLIGLVTMHAGRLPHFLAKESIFDVPVVGGAMRRMGHIPVRRGTADARQSFDAAVRALERGELIVMHPEGTVTRDPDGWPMAGKTGAARLAQLAPGVPIIPVAQWGVQDAVDLYHKKVKPIPRKIHRVSVGEPIDLSPYFQDGPEISQLNAATTAIMTRLRSDVATLRGLPVPAGDLFVWRRPPSGTS